MDMIDVVCICLPNGTNLWCEAGDMDYVRRVMDKWKDEHPEYVGGECTCGFVIVRMPRKDYIAIGTNNSFEWPAASADRREE